MGKLGDQPNMGFHPILVSNVVKWRVYSGTEVNGHFSSNDLSPSQMQSIVDVCDEDPTNWNAIRAVVVNLPGCGWIDNIPTPWRSQFGHAILLCHSTSL